jgi:hypothetical protein
MQTKSTRGVQLEEVCSAADALVAEGLRPTIERVRLKIGRGSPNTVAPMLETWFAMLAPRLGVAPASDSGQGVPHTVREALDKVWTVALAAATEQATQAIAQDQQVLATERQTLAQARESLQTQQAALADRELILQESLALARDQLSEASQRGSQIQAKLEHAEADLGSARQSLADLVQGHATERRAHSEQLRSQAGDLQRAQELATSTERRLLADVDRARQDAKQARGGLAEAQRAHEKKLKELERVNEALGGRFQQAQIETACLRERLAGAEGRATDLQGILDAQRAMAIGPRPAQRQAVKKTRAMPQK